MPVPDLGARSSAMQRLRLAQARRFVQRLANRMPPGRRHRGDGSGEAVPTEPNRPLDLSGGAAAALEFED